MESKPQKRRYDEAEARAILDRALRRDTEQGIEHDDLVAAAREVGISEEALTTALQEVETSRAEDEVRRTIIRRRRRDLGSHALAYFFINGSLALVALLITGGWWFLWPTIGWGVGLVFHARDALRRSVSTAETRRELRRRERAEGHERRRLERDQAQSIRQARHEAIERGAEQLGSAVEKGVALLMSKVSEKIKAGIGSDAAAKEGSRTEPRDDGASRRSTGRDESDD